MQSGGLLELGAGSRQAARTAYEDGHYKTTIPRAYHAANHPVVWVRAERRRSHICPHP